MREPNEFPLWADGQLSVEIQTLCARGEGQSVEFKEVLPKQAHDIAKSIAAFASSNAGYLIYGVANDGRILGLQEAVDEGGRDRIAQRVQNAAKDIRPPVHPTVAWVVHDEMIVCVVKVEKGFDAIYYSNQRPIVRRGNTSRPAEPGEVEEVFRSRYADRSKAPPLPSTRKIAERLTRVLALMNDSRCEPKTVADLARAMGLASPADLDAVFAGHLPATFAMLDQFCARFAVDKDWVASGRDVPFSSQVEYRPQPEDYLSLIEASRPEVVYVVRSESRVGESFLVVEIEPMKFWRIPDVWHVSSQNGGGGAGNLVSLYRLFKRWSNGTKSYMVLGRSVEHKLAQALFEGEIYPGVIANLPLSHWWDDLIDLEQKWTSRSGNSKAYGEEFVVAQDIIREMLSSKSA